MAIVLRPRQQNNQTISIGFSGAAGVGKTTLVKELFSYYKKQGLIVDVINEVARDIFSIYSQTHGVRTLEEMRLIPELYLMFQNDVLEIPFELEFVYVQSEMDKLESNNIFAKGLVKFAKKLRNVKSEYTLRADAKIKGTTLSPFDIKPLKLV